MQARLLHVHASTTAGLYTVAPCRPQHILPACRVGPVVGEASKKIRPAFQLLEGRYGGVSQERGRYIIGGRSPIVQPNYGLLSTQSAIHRGSTQRLVSELLQRLGVHILSNRPVKVGAAVHVMQGSLLARNHHPHALHPLHLAICDHSPPSVTHMLNAYSAFCQFTVHTCQTGSCGACVNHCTHTLQCEFPGLGWLVTNKAGRIEFIFESLIMEWFEREHYALIREVRSAWQAMCLSTQAQLRHVLDLLHAGVHNCLHLQGSGQMLASASYTVLGVGISSGAPAACGCIKRTHGYCLGCGSQMDYAPEDHQVLKALQHVNLSDPPYIKRCAYSYARYFPTKPHFQSGCILAWGHACCFQAGGMLDVHDTSQQAKANKIQTDGVS